MVTIYPVVKWLFKKFLWKTKFFRYALNVPDLNEQWEGILHSTYDGGRDTPITLKINQDWENMSCYCEFTETDSISDALIINLDISDSSRPKLIFTYKNQSHNAEETLLQIHVGYNELIIEDNQMKGFYFTNRVPQTKGTITLTRQ